MNASWPHHGHKLYNMGEPGADVIPTLLSCPQTLLGGISPDLVLVDVTVNGPEYYERLLRLLLTSWAPPPAVVFTLFGVCHTGLEPRNSRPQADPAHACGPCLGQEFSDRKEVGRKGGSTGSILAQLVRAAVAAREVEGGGEAEEAPLTRQVVEALHAPPPGLRGVGWDNGAEQVPQAWARSSFLGRTLLQWAKAQGRPLHRMYLWREYLMAAEVLKLQQAYGVSVVSAFGAYAEEFEDHAHGGLHLYHWACRDGLHPNNDARAHKMMGQLIAHAVEAGLRAQRRDDGNAIGSSWRRRRRGRSSGGSSGTAFGLLPSDGDAYVLPPPLRALPRREGLSCFTFDEEGFEIMRGARHSNRLNYEHSVSRVGLGPPPTMLAHDGWSFANYEPNSRSAFKPGVSATRPGATLRLRVDTSRVRWPILSLQHLTSFEHMGRVRATCAGCVCTPEEIDAHTMLRVSTTALHSLRVTPHNKCELSLTVLNATSSGEHKWKLERLLLESDLGMSG